MDHEYMIRTEHLSKIYTLGVIGQTTLKDESQRIAARLAHREDPTKKIGANPYADGEQFYALRDVNLTVRPGEAVGIIGHNGAGKSTLLKLLTRVTAPSEGDIWLNGRVASMLEVGTGFHPELTGRENIYLNGAILGMTRKEIDEKLDEIIDFSECAQFIDTPVKRYSSGMYVKLAFAVAAHLNSDIMLLDEVLAVGDIRFQQKCIKKIADTVSEEGKTVLFVSHNMETIRQLCPRSIVLDHGSVIYDGDTETAVLKYLGESPGGTARDADLTEMKHMTQCTGSVRLTGMHVYNSSFRLSADDVFDLTFDLQAERPEKGVRFMMILFYQDGTRIGKTESADFDVREGSDPVRIAVPLKGLADGSYYFEVLLIHHTGHGIYDRLDGVSEVLSFQIANPWAYNVTDAGWDIRKWGHMMLDPIVITDEEERAGL